MGFALGYSWEASRIGSAKNVKRKSGAVVALEAEKSDPVRILTQFLGRYNKKFLSGRDIYTGSFELIHTCDKFVYEYWRWKFGKLLGRVLVRQIRNVFRIFRMY